MATLPSKQFVKVGFWLTGAVAATCTTYFHFKYGSFGWALTDIPFVFLLFYAFFHALKDRATSRGSSIEQKGGENT
ncbi:MAG TPA: hypothetical protein VKZ53_30165 [Candidatus Angelobacter sp.]|nr:hypothetical protein [Candidatus Angelobacter sp.]